MGGMQHKSYKSFDQVKGANIHMMAGCQSSQQALHCKKTVSVIHFMLGLIDVSDVHKVYLKKYFKVTLLKLIIVVKSKVILDIVTLRS